MTTTCLLAYRSGASFPDVRVVTYDPVSLGVTHRTLATARANPLWQRITLHEQADKHWIATFVDSGLVLTVEQDGTLTTRDAGANGLYQMLAGGIAPSGEKVMFRADGIGPVLFVVDEVTL